MNKKMRGMAVDTIRRKLGLSTNEEYLASRKTQFKTKTRSGRSTETMLLCLKYASQGEFVLFRAEPMDEEIRLRQKLRTWAGLVKIPVERILQWKPHEGEPGYENHTVVLDHTLTKG